MYGSTDENQYFCIGFEVAKSTFMDKMEINRQSGYAMLDCLIENNLPFALYRLPGEEEPNLVMQETEETCLRLNNLTELDGRTGFMVAPFLVRVQTPVILIRPEIVLRGETAIFDHLRNKKWTIPSRISPLAGRDETFSGLFASYAETYRRFQVGLEEEHLKKLVLSRIVTEGRTADFSAGRTFERAKCRYPDHFVYLCHTPETGTWLGCSPELLFSGKRRHGHTVALAGTLLADGKSRWDRKNLDEQQIVTDYIKEQLEKAGYPYQAYGPFSVRSGNLLHLKTEFSFPLSDAASVGQLLQALHPTPAVCGLPKEEAQAFILENEKIDRRYYSGFLGGINLGDRTDLYVNLRCAEINTHSLRIYAGGGILPSSHLQSEWEETENKLQTIRSLLRTEGGFESIEK